MSFESVKSLRDDALENYMINDNDASRDHYDDDEDADDYDDDYNDDDDDDDDYTNGGYLNDDLPENELVYTNDENDYDDVDYNDDDGDDDDDKLNDDNVNESDDKLENNEKPDNDNSQSTEEEPSKNKIAAFNFDDNPDMSASDAIYQINKNSGVINNPNTFEGDIILDDSRLQEVAQWGVENGVTKRSAMPLNDREYRWPNQVLVYRIARNGRDRYAHNLTEFRKAIAEFTAKTCITFRKAKNKNEYHIRIISGYGCHSNIGRIRGVGKKGKYRQRQNVEIGRDCNHKAIIVHELLHALGFWHEQSRADRNKYVKILWQNIVSGTKNSNFEKHSERDTADLGVEYDYKSVMHYGEYYFSKNGKITIKRSHGDGPLGQTNDGGLSQKDAEKLNRYYECNTCTDTEVYVFIKSLGCRIPGAKWCKNRNPLIKVNDFVIHYKFQGATVVVLDGKTGKVVDNQNERTENMGRYLGSLKPGKLVLLTVKGYWRNAVNGELRRSLKRIGANVERVLSRKTSFALIGWTGPGKISVIKEVHAGRKNEGPSVISEFISFPLI